MLYINIKTTMFARSRVCQNCTKIILEHLSQRSLNNLLLGDCGIYISSIIISFFEPPCVPFLCVSLLFCYVLLSPRLCPLSCHLWLHSVK